MKLTFQRRLTLSFLIIFVIFTAGVVVFEQGQARRYRTEALEERLDAYAEMIHACVAGDTPDSIDLKVLLPLLPQELRLTVIGASGEVVYDNLFAEPGELDNHAGRPEVANARKQGASYDIRTSASNHIPYIYYAKYFGNDFVRVALPYDVKVKHFLQPDNGFLYFIVILFAVGLLFIHYVGSLFGRSVKRLRDFASTADDADADLGTAHFPHDELGEIGQRIAGSYKSLKESERTLGSRTRKTAPARTQFGRGGMLLSTGRLGGILQRPVPAIHEYHQRRSGKRQPRPPDARRIRTRPTFPRVRVWRTVFRNAPSGPGQGVPAARERFRRQKFRGGVQRHHPTGEDAPPETGDDRQHRPRTPHTGNEHPGLPRNGARNADAARKGAGLHHQSLPADARAIGTHPRHEPAHEDRRHARVPSISAE